MTHKAPGKSHRKGMTLLQVADKFQDEKKATIGLKRHVGRMTVLSLLRVCQCADQHQA